MLFVGLKALFMGVIQAFSAMKSNTDNLEGHTVI